ncbi:MAG: ABC transporter ATP-binding protein [Oligoflexales bacterium]|nr:ABC transporter ATP-binding protein [Oligoflexales bacterium]
MIKVKNLTRKYGSFTAVNSISFDINRGEIIGLLGHNGAGKTTTLKILTGYLEASSGRVEIGGFDIATDRLSVQKKIGYLSEQTSLYPEMSIWQYLEYVAELRDIPVGERPRAIKDALEATELTHKAGDIIDILSKGYKQRVGVAQAIIHKPELLILDEPTNGLDPTQILAMRELIRNLSKTTTVIISTHVLQEVEAICSRVIIILNGRVAIDSPLADLKHNNNVTLSLKQELSEVRDCLAGVSGIRRISHLSTLRDIHNYNVEIDRDVDSVTPVLAKTMVQKGWGLYGMHSEHRDLETVFAEVNRGQKGGEHV